VKGLLGDAARAVWAMFYWNARKSAFRWRGRRDGCPCQNPSDSGEGGRTRCEAVLGWREPRRFRQVCPLLVPRAEGGWVCSVDAADVRPFWGRAVAWLGGALAVLALAGGLGLFTAMRGLGYPVSLRQVLWPPAWRELRAVRAELFIAQARENFLAGRVPEALSALRVAHEMDPRNYAVAMMLAQFHRASQPAAADALYAKLLRDHPQRAVETARTWYFSLLTRGQLTEAAELAAQRIAAEPDQAAAWTHALVFTLRRMGRPEKLESAAGAAPPAAAGVLRLEARLLREPDPAARRKLLQDTPLPDSFPYAWMHRANRFIGEGQAGDARQLLAAAFERKVLAGRDLVALELAARATQNDGEGLKRTSDLLLARGGPAELQILAQHLIVHPRRELLARVLAAMPAPAPPTDDWRAALLALYCAAGVEKDRPALKLVRERFEPTFGATQAGLAELELFFLGRLEARPFFTVLPRVEPLPTELLYALLERHLEMFRADLRAPSQMKLEKPVN